ncbi:uncharacterized protein [Mytilus edulis]
MKQLWFSLFIYFTCIRGGTLTRTWFRAMNKNSKNSNSTTDELSSPFKAFGRQLDEEIAKTKIKMRMCGYLKQLCKTTIDRKPLITTVNPRETTTNAATEPTSSTASNINISLVFSEPSEYSNDTNCMKFKLPEESTPGKSLPGADVFVYITNRRKRPDGKRGRRRRRRKRQRKITIKVSLLNEHTRHKKFISRLRFRPNPDKKWNKLVLPFSVIKKANQLKERVLNLCIDCKRCNRNTQIVLPLKTLKKRHKFMKTKHLDKSRKPLKLRKKRPFLMFHEKESKQRQRRDTKSCSKDNPVNQCCRYQEYIRFSDIGLGDRVAYPDGFYKTECIGSCSYNSTNVETNSTRSRKCYPSKYKPLQTYLVFDSSVTFLDIPKGHIEECTCH